MNVSKLRFSRIGPLWWAHLQRYGKTVKLKELIISNIPTIQNDRPFGRPHDALKLQGPRASVLERWELEVESQPIWSKINQDSSFILLMVQKSGVHQLRLVVYLPIIFRVSKTSQVVVKDFWTINSIMIVHPPKTNKFAPENRPLTPKGK